MIEITTEVPVEKNDSSQDWDLSNPYDLLSKFLNQPWPQEIWEQFASCTAFRGILCSRLSKLLIENWDIFQNHLLSYLKLGICIKLPTGCISCKCPNAVLVDAKWIIDAYFRYLVLKACPWGTQTSIKSY